MNSSGIKRGLAATAVGALAVTGLPFLASSASADSGDTWSQIAGGPVRNGNADGGSVILKSSSPNIDGDIYVTSATYTGDLDADTEVGAADPQISSPAFDVHVLSVTLLDADEDTLAIDKFSDGSYHYEAITAVTLGTASKASFGLVEDADGNGAVNASDPKAVVEVTPTGAPASVDVKTSQPAGVVGFPVPFTADVKDSAGNLTQLVDGEEFDVTTAGADLNPAVNGEQTTLTLDEDEFVSGTAKFTATPSSGGTKTVTVTGDEDISSDLVDSASFTAYANATITKDEFGIATGADTWEDGVTAFGAPDQQIRVDQNSVTFNFQGKDDVNDDGTPDDANKVVALLLESDTIKFNGQAADDNPVVVPVLLDGSGKGSATVALSNVTANSTFTFAAPGSITSGNVPVVTEITMARPTADSVEPNSEVYVTKVGSPTSVTVTVEDQFGNPIGAPAQVSITRGARNGSTTTERVTVNASGQATFSLPDAGTTTGNETILINLYEDQFASGDMGVEDATITYTTDGLGGNFTAASDSTSITPLYDSAASAAGADTATISILNGTPGASATVTVDNGALVLQTNEADLTKGSASDTVTLGAGGTGAFRVVGTKTGTVTVTIETGGRSKTVTLTVAQPTDKATRVATARNIAITAPEEAKAGEVASFEVKVTDAFGNTVAGFPAGNLTFQVSGPANGQGTTETETDANGVIHANVVLSDNADSPVTVRVTATGAQFGSAANKIGNVDAQGLSASVATANATVTDVVNIAELEERVEEAQAKVDAAQVVLDNARGDLQVAKAERSVAQSNVKAAKKDLKQAKKQKKGVKAAKAALRNAKGDLKVAKAKVTSAQNKVNNAKAALAKAQEQLAAAEAELEAAQS